MDRSWPNWPSGRWRAGPAGYGPRCGRPGWYQPHPLAVPIRLDLVWERERCVVEIDGDDHRQAAKFAADRARDVRLVEECALRGVSAIVIDPNNDLARLGDPWPEEPPGWEAGDRERAREYLENTDVVVWTPGRAGGRPLAFQPLVGLPSPEQRQSFVSQLQMELFVWFKRHPAQDRPLGALPVTDEAQTFAPATGTAASTRSTVLLASQARKYGLGLVFATQAPKGLHNHIPGNAATQFFGLLNAPIQITAAKEMAKQKGGDVPDISRLGAGQFSVASEESAFTKTRVPMCLTWHPKSPLTTEEVIGKSRR
ncbi:hypothetical protein ABZW11_39305 [Nonomuraea sp. NPDC004580]|uniref:hypothetical protein n=1 Tax=Nonomuraea sp. NPDC004580 TaxID=3154552 RepID=UPI0033B000BE